MVLRDLGLGFLPKLSVKDELQKGKLRAIEVSDAETLHRSLDVIRSRHHALSASGMEFLDLLRAATQEASTPRKRTPSPLRVEAEGSE
jgi:DNA-binding transcriptional LysR family regulator